ncbi:MAG: ROK family transcriptional regulator [Chloroflexota bacterium]
MDHRVTILEMLRGGSPASRAELAERSGLSPATVSRAVDRLRADGFVREVAIAPAGLGRPPRLVELRPEAAYVVGVDAGGSMLRAVLADLDGTVCGRAARPASDPDDLGAILRDLAQVVRDVEVAAEGRPILAASAGISGIVDHAAGSVLLSPDLPGLDGAPIAALLGDVLGVPVIVDNDDLLAAIGEAAVGAARGCTDVAFLSLGYGLGAGLIVDGRPVRGASSAAGAIAYLAPGRLEERASGRPIPDRYREALRAAERRSPGADRPRARSGEVAADAAYAPHLDARGVFELAAGGDPIAMAIVADVADALGELVVNVAALLDPEVVVLGGGLVANGAILVDPLARRLAEALPFPPRLVGSALEGAAVVHGGVSVALAAAKQRLAGADAPARVAPEPGRLGALDLV